MFDDIIKRNAEKAKKAAAERIDSFNKVLNSYKINRKASVNQPPAPQAPTQSPIPQPIDTVQKQDTVIFVDFAAKKIKSNP